jgi:hypothetical protein
MYEIWRLREVAVTLPVLIPSRLHHSISLPSLGLLSSLLPHHYILIQSMTPVQTPPMDSTIPRTPPPTYSILPPAPASSPTSPSAPASPSSASLTRINPPAYPSINSFTEILGRPLSPPIELTVEVETREGWSWLDSFGSW